MTVVNYHQYRYSMYQSTTRKNFPSSGIVENLAIQKGIAGTIGRTIFSVIGPVSLPEEKGPTFIVFNEGSWSEEYELTLILSQRHPFVKTDFHYLGGEKFSSPDTIDGLVQNHSTLFGGSIKSSRMGPVLEYSERPTTTAIKKIKDYYESIG